MSKLIICRGLPGSGKSHYAKAWVQADEDNRVMVERDQIRLMLFGSRLGDKSQEKLVTKIHQTAILEALGSGKDVIVSDTNLNNRFFPSLVSLGDGHDVQIKDFNTPIEECIRRVIERGDPGYEVIVKQMVMKFFVDGEFPPPRMPEGKTMRKHIPDETLPSAWVFDVDGTLQKNVSGRGFFDWDRVHEDVAVPSVVNLAKSLKTAGHQIIIVSGRDEVCMDATLSNVTSSGVPVDAIFMRPHKNNEKDADIKERIFFNDIAPNWNVCGWVDDRDQVVDRMRSIGLTVFQVERGAF